MRRTKRYYFKGQNACGICGKHIDKTFKVPHPLSHVVDYMLPIIKGSHPSSMEDL
ncbi:conserved hypothetical protein [Enterococcus casseliflavus EC10]|nr:conserved hypothetical protein [Enterococcus casseliflavus EC10]